MFPDSYSTGQEGHCIVGDPIRILGESDQASLDSVGRVSRRHAIEVGTGRRRCWAGVRNFAGMGGGNLDAVDIDLQFFSDDLGYFH